MLNIRHQFAAQKLLGNAALCLAAALSLSPAVAGTMTASIAYDTAGLSDSSWLVPASASISDPVSANASVDDLPPIPYYGYNLYHSTYMWGNAASNISGALSTAADLRAGGILQSTASWSESFTNTTGGASAYQIHFSIGAFNASLGGWSSNYATRDYRGSFAADILVNGVSVWSSGQVFSLQAGSAGLQKTGTDIGTGTVTPASNSEGYWQYEIGTYNGTASLGTFAAGQTFNVQYVLKSTAYWHDPDGCAYECGSVFTSIGDPFNNGGTGISVTAVPEPETYAMLMAGLGVLGATVRRRRMAVA